MFEDDPPKPDLRYRIGENLESYSVVGTFSTSFGFGFEATHWMPLPAPPADAK